MKLKLTVSIIGLSVLAACVFGILHDLVTASVCLEYFTEFHPDFGFPKTVIGMALSWGIIATWWVGLPLGVVLALASQAGSRPVFPIKRIVKGIVVLIAVMGVGSLIAGLIGYAVGGPFAPMVFTTPSAKDPGFYDRFAADLFAHNASYFVGIIGGLGLAVWVWMKRASLTS